tara:strand:+ start:289 stop:903 length:615 start_codon:yes stop_codon:yes gene_type:complete
MPVVKQVTYYSFDELSEQAQQRVIDKVREWDDRYSADEEFILQDLRERHPHIHQMDIRYSGFCSQGDGASFTGYIGAEWVINNLLSDELKTIVRDLDCAFERNSNMYCHENTVSTQLEDVTWADHIEENDRLRESLLEQHYDDIVDVIEEYRLDLCHTIYRELERAYEQCHSEENIAEFVLDNDYLFDTDGNFYPYDTIKLKKV